jgi:hypothetical protein
MSNGEFSEMLTVQEIAKRLRVAPSWVYGHADDLGAYRLGKYLRFDWNRVLASLGEAQNRRFGLSRQSQRASGTLVKSV